MSIFNLTPLLLIFNLIASPDIAIECSEKINLQPMYGNQPKCRQQLEADSIFFVECDKLFESRKDAAINYVNNAWEYYNKGDLDIAMKRFNQAWLLDTTLPDIYWGFGNILGSKEQYEASVPLLEKSISLDAGNPLVFESLAITYLYLFINAPNDSLAEECIRNLETAISLDPKQARFYGRLAFIYKLLGQGGNAKKYLSKADELDSSVVTTELRNKINSANH